jgi:hypothetical protein
LCGCAHFVWVFQRKGVFRIGWRVWVGDSESFPSKMHCFPCVIFISAT